MRITVKNNQTKNQRGYAFSRPERGYVSPFHFKRRGCLSLTEPKNHRFVLGSRTWAHPWWRVASEPRLYHSELGTRNWLPLTFCCHIRVPPTAEVKFHQEPKRRRKSPELLGHAPPGRNSDTVLLSTAHCIWNNNNIIGRYQYGWFCDHWICTGLYLTCERLCYHPCQPNPEIGFP